MGDGMPGDGENTLYKKWQVKLENLPAIAALKIVGVAVAVLLAILADFKSVMAPSEKLPAAATSESTRMETASPPSPSLRAQTPAANATSSIEAIPSSSPPAPSISQQPSISAPTPDSTPEATAQSHDDLVVLLDEPCGAPFHRFDALKLSNAINEDVRLRGGQSQGMLVRVAAGYRPQPSLEDSGTTIRAYASIALCEQADESPSCNPPAPDCDNSCPYGSNRRQQGNIEDALDSVARLAADLLRNSQHRQGAITCPRSPPR
ncbi:MAG TPA: hypothetical protein VGD45_22965 [Steroidobacter sp.]|uniref:hypothetical protein n=1 Tax=Steroidobacter sp. TaxID=1978227 RepID=UPI002EDB3162